MTTIIMIETIGTTMIRIILCEYSFLVQIILSPAGREKPEMFLAARIRVDATYSLKSALCSSEKTSLDASRSIG